MSAPSGDLDTRVTRAARIRSWPLLAIERASQDASGRRLPYTAGTGKDERLRETVLGDGVAECLRDTPLTNDILELLRPILSRENLIGHH